MLASRPTNQTTPVFCCPNNSLCFLLAAVVWVVIIREFLYTVPHHRHSNCLCCSSDTSDVSTLLPKTHTVPKLARKQKTYSEVPSCILVFLLSWCRSCFMSPSGSRSHVNTISLFCSMQFFKSADVELNPGPRCLNTIYFSYLNVRCNKFPL